MAHNELTKTETVVNLACHNQQHQNKYINYAQINFNKKIYEKHLANAMGIEYGKIFVYSKSHVANRNRNYDVPKNILWPHNARRKPLIGPPSIILDMPELTTDICHHVVDWSSKGVLATVYDREVYLWYSENKRPCLLTNTHTRIENCVSWNRSGDCLAMAMKHSGIAVWDYTAQKTRYETTCCCRKDCVVTCAEWTKGDRLITGCSEGRLSVWSRESELMKSIFPAHRGAIITIQLSKAERYLGSSGIDRKIRLWLWPSLVEHFEILVYTPVRAIAWHPWKDSLLCIGDSATGTLSLWNMNSVKEVASKREPGTAHVDNLTWSEISGELVVSYWRESENYTSTSKESSIVVYSSFDDVVDGIEWHTGRVPYLIWGSDGTQLATASSDENLCIWDFFGTSSERNAILKKRKKTKKFTTDPVEIMNIFGICIR